LRSAEQKVGFGHQHLIVHVLSRSAVTCVARDAHVQVIGCQLLGFHGRVADVTLAVAARLLGLRFLRHRDCQSASKNCNNNDRRDKIRFRSNV
jgi:hypothetical protein